jgi:hypothetical protein
LSIDDDPVTRNQQVNMTKSSVPTPVLENIDPLDISNDEAEELADREQLMLDREDYYQLVSDC